MARAGDAAEIALVAAIGLAVAAAALLVASRVHDAGAGARCGAGFVAVGARCCLTPQASADGACALSCAPEEARVAIPETTIVVGASDWEAEGRVAARTVHTAPFAIDAYEATVDDVACPGCRPAAAPCAAGDHGRAASGLTRDEAARYCAAKGGRLPTEDEWLAAAAGASARRYPWGDTGAVCRRAAWGLARGPCSHAGRGPDTVGAHPDGDTAEHVHDLAGNVAEWVTTGGGGGGTRPGGDARIGVARGGSWRTALASELRTWARLELDPAARDDRVGVRCVYAVASKVP